MTAEEPAKRATLVSRHPGTFGSQHPLDADELVIGRAQDAGLFLDSSGVSRHHARISWTGSTYLLEDLDSTNGTWPNERRLTEPASLSNGDLIRFGDVPFVFSLDDSAKETMIFSSAPAPSLVNILFTDITNSTALRQRLGDSKALTLVRTHDSIVRGALAEHGGREIKHTGDGIMASFISNSSALRCAAAIQLAVATHAREHPDPPLAVHLGLNAGEPIAEGLDIFGTAVDLARRICDEAGAGDVLVSAVVKDLAAGSEFVFAERGFVEFKGFEDPVRVHELIWNPDVRT